MKKPKVRTMPMKNAYNTVITASEWALLYLWVITSVSSRFKALSRTLARVAAAFEKTIIPVKRSYRKYK